ncbi:transposase [Streptomyces decoyicus]
MSTSTARPCPEIKGARSKYQKLGDEPADHAIGRSRGGLTTKTHLVADGKGRAQAFVLTGGQVADTTVLPDTLDEIRVAGATGRPRQHPDRLPADKGYPSRANRAWLRERGIATTIPLDAMATLFFSSRSVSTWNSSSAPCRSSSI